MTPAKVNLREKLELFRDTWTPRIVAELNGQHVKLVKLDGEFVWHSHADADELFLVIDGSLTIELRDGRVTLEPGELYVVPRGVEHRPVAAGPVNALLLEPVGTINTGDAGGIRTVPEPDWI